MKNQRDSCSSLWKTPVLEKLKRYRAVFQQPDKLDHSSIKCFFSRVATKLGGMRDVIVFSFNCNLMVMMLLVNRRYSKAINENSL